MLLAFLNGYGQKIDLSDLQPNDSTIYFFSRGSVAKSGMIAGKFNLQDKNSTHVGIGYFEGKSATIFNITDSKPTNQSAFEIDNIESFVKGNVYYFSIWKCDNDANDLKALKKIGRQYANRKMTFDYSFRIGSDDALYCSEFCARVMKQVNPSKFDFVPLETTLDEFYQILFERETISYFPVDFFEKQTIKIFEQYMPEPL